MSEPDIFESQEQLATRIDRFASNYLKTPKDRFNLGYLTAREIGLKALWTDFVANDDAINSQTDKEEQSEHAYFTDNLYDKYENIYFDILGRICQRRLELTTPPPVVNPIVTPVVTPVVNPILDSITPDPNANHSHPPADNHPVDMLNQSRNAVGNPLDHIPPMLPPLTHHVQIPRLNVPKFSGSYEEWPSFRDLFIAAVHSNTTLRPVHKLQYLKSLLTGTAETVLRHIAITADNYAVAWRQLEDRFENKRALVNMTLRKLFSQRPSIESASSIRQLLDTTRECIGSLHIQAIDTTSWDSILIYIVSQNIPAISLDLWEQQIPRNQLPSLDNLLNFLEDRFRALEFSEARSPSQPIRSRAKPQSFHAVSTGCRLCQGPQHPLRLCPSFIEMSTAQRLNQVKKAKLCKNCFAYSHQTPACNSAGRCNVCGERHHSMLHFTSSAPVNTSQHCSTPQRTTTIPIPSTSSSQASPRINPFQQPQSTSTGPTPTQSSSPQQTPCSNSLVSRQSSSTFEDSILATALVYIKSFDGQSHSFRALLDNASQESFVSRRVVQFLGVKPQPTSVVVNGVGQTQAPKALGHIQFEFGSHHDPSFTMQIDAIVLPSITHTLPSKPVLVDPALVAQLELADPTYGTPGSIDVLLSASVFAALTLPAVRKEADASTVALQTKLGWVLFGEASAETSIQHRTCFHVTSEDRVSAALQQFWKVEEIESAHSHSPEDDQCEHIYATTHTRTSDGRYCVQLPFKTNPPLLGTSRDRAVSRFLQVERKLAGNPQLREDYANCIHEYIQLGHMYRISTPEPDHTFTLPDGTVTQASYYLPHHAVIKTESTTTKLRVVFDASSKSMNNVSLNDTLLIGPTLQDGLFNQLIRWRTNKIVIKADVAKMYRQVLVSENHHPYQRIIWRDKPTDELQDFQLRTVTFGTAAAPYLAVKTLQQLADDEAVRFPIGAKMLKHDFYVDDLLAGADTVSEAIEKQQQVTKILQCGGFEIRKWSSNNTGVTNLLEDDALDLCTGSQTTLKALGILWCPQRDTLSIKVSTLADAVQTKRSLLSEVSKLFDPLGWIAPTIITMKILLQKLWLAGLSWDEPLPVHIQNEWCQFKHQLPSIESIAIHRWIQMSPNSSVEIHGFSDASERAYAAAVYIRVKISNSEWAVHLITAKTRVAPVKQLSLPRLELCGSVLLAKLIVSVQNIIKPSQIHAWTDSEIVLAWLQGHPNRWTTFVGNRVANIHESIDAGVWHHVPSKDNPADCASRGIPPEQLASHPLWWHGPVWLSKDNSHWPRKHKIDISSIQIEAKRTAQSFGVTTSVNDTLIHVLETCHSLAKASRIIAFMRRWRTVPKSSPAITVDEISAAHIIMIRHTQQTCFPEEFAHLSTNKAIPKSSKLLSLNPFIDKHQLIRVGGRLQNANIPYPMRHPIILPRKSRLTELIIHDAHIHTLHGSISLMQSHIRTHYWIIDARNAIRHIIHKCNTCFRYSNPSLNQLMGQLPKPRVNVANPFSHTGIDYAGPISILLRRRPGRPQVSKGYICLFVCLATKAIHLELVGDMTAATFQAALNRFVSRRGLPSDIYSDNGTYFVRAATDIDADMKKVLKKHTTDVASAAVHQSTQWHFIPPAAPHFGGLWEAGVKSTKYHLRRIVGDGSCTYEEMSTILCQIEGCLNSRPLCPISNDPDDFEILTPGHFLIGRPIRTLPQPSFLEIPQNRLTYWQRILQRTERFWRQWQSEYLSRMQQRPKWSTPSSNVEIGQLVLLKEDNLPPSQWKLARIIEVHKGADDNIRVVTLKTPTSILKRPVVKICQLPSQ